MRAPDVCPEVEVLWHCLVVEDRSAVELADVADGLADHVLRHGCDLVDVQAVMIDLRLMSTSDPIQIAGLGAMMQKVGDRCVVWRAFLLRSLGNIVAAATDSGAADAVAARRELRRLCRLWGLPSAVGAWRG